MDLRIEQVEAAVLGGAILGGGGGGSIAEGLRLGREALVAGTPRLIGLDEMPAGAQVATASLVGAPAARGACVAPADYARAWELLVTMVDGPVLGVISCENGGTATVNGWLQSAVFGIPVVDAPSDGRAHPTGEMGSMGLERLDGFVASQAAGGGSREKSMYIEQCVTGSLKATNRLIRAASEEAGGLVAVARNPVTVEYLRQHAAPGALSQALSIGERLRVLGPHPADEAIEVLGELLSGFLVFRGEVDTLDLRTHGGYDVGMARIGPVELTIWNEYLTLELEGERMATFPDLIVTLDSDSAMALTSAELAVGRRVAVIIVPASRLILGTGLRVPENFLPLETAVSKDIVKYLPLASV